MTGHDNTADEKTTSLTCIGCPVGCVITVAAGRGDQLVITGAQCARGESYARSEAIHPVRTLTTLIAVPGCRTPLSVKTSQPVPRERIKECLEAIHQTRILLPVALGSVVIADLLGTGSDVIATRSLPVQTLAGTRDSKLELAMLK